jgi:hypothetical protein
VKVGDLIKYRDRPEGQTYSPSIDKLLCCWGEYGLVIELLERENTPGLIYMDFNGDFIHAKQSNLRVVSKNR